jgi:hypothetical protein
LSVRIREARGIFNATTGHEQSANRKMGLDSTDENVSVQEPHKTGEAREEWRHVDVQSRSLEPDYANSIARLTISANVRKMSPNEYRALCEPGQWLGTFAGTFAGTFTGSLFDSSDSFVASGSGSASVISSPRRIRS